MNKISKQALGQKFNFYIITSGTVDNVSTDKQYPPLSMLLVPVDNTDNTDYKMFLTDNNGYIHRIIT